MVRFEATKFGWVNKKLEMFEAMVFKRKIGTSCCVDVKMLDTIKDGIVLSIEQNLVNSNNLIFIKDFVNEHKLSLLLDSERYYISTNAIAPYMASLWG